MGQWISSMEFLHSSEGSIIQRGIPVSMVINLGECILSIQDLTIQWESCLLVVCFIMLTPLSVIPEVCSMLSLHCRGRTLWVNG